MKKVNRIQPPRDNYLLFTVHCLLFIIAQLLIINYPLPTFAQSVTEGFRLKKMEGTAVKWELEADSARLEENLKTLQVVKVKFYPKNKDPFLIKAEEGWVRQNEKDEIYLKKNVQVIGYLKSDVKCESLCWDSVSEIIYTSDKVEIEGEKWHIRGEGIEFSPSGDVITIKKDVTMDIN